MSDGWAQLPEAIMEAMLKQVVLADYIRFSAVCVSWRSVTFKRTTRPRRQLPWLMANDSPEADSIRFFSPSENRYYNLKLPKPANCWGAYEGWLMIEFQKNRRKNFLFNPMTGEKVRIPPFSTLPYPVQYHIHMAILSSDPVVLSSLVVVCLHDEGNLALCTPGDTKCYAGGDKETHYVAIMFLNGYLYALDNQGELWCSSHIIDTTNFRRLRFTKKENIGVPPGFESQEYLSGLTLYLAEKDGKVLMVAKRWMEEEVRERVIRRKVDWFRVFELDERSSRWNYVNYIGEYMLVLGSCYAKSFSANDTSGAVANTIYFTNEFELFARSITTGTHRFHRYPIDPCWLSVYNFEHPDIRPAFPESLENQHRFYSPSKWFSPDAWHRLE